MALLINGRKAIHRQAGAVLRTNDLCHFHGSVVCFTNIALSQDAAGTAKTVFHNGHALCHKQSYFSKSSGDEASAGGVHSGTKQGKATFTSASADVFIEGQAAVRLLDTMVSNDQNTDEGVLC